MMSAEVWLSRIKEAVSAIADRDYQQRAWFESGPEVSSPVEMYCNLFDDFDYGNFLCSPQVGLTDEQKDLGTTLKEKMDAYSALIGDQPDPSDVIDDPRWDEIRQAAQRLLDKL